MQSNLFTDTAKKNSMEAATESRKMGFHLYDPDEEDEQEESAKEPQLIPTELVPPRAGSSSLLKLPSSRSESIDAQSPCFVYELTGIVIHSGQAHAGHYYSFIRDRGRMEPYKGFDRERSQSITAMLGPHNFQNPIRNFVRTDTLTQGADDIATGKDASQPERWLKFNDTYIEEVDMTDEFLQQECFGGTYLAETPVDEGRSQKPRFSVDLVHSPVPRGSHRSVQFSRPLHSNSTNTTSVTRQPQLSLGQTSNHLRASPIPSGRPSSTCLFALSGSNGGLDGRKDSLTGEIRSDSPVDSTLPTAGSGTNADNASSSADEMLHRIRKQNLAFLRDQSILSPDYVSFTYNLAQGVLVDTAALQLEPERAIMGCQMVANFLFATYLALHASVKVSISPELCKRLLGLCAPAPQNGGEKSSHHHTSASEQASLQEAGTKLDTHWMETLLALMTANAQAISWSLGFLVRSPTKPILNYVLACPKPQLRHQSARLVGIVLSTFYASKDASILDAALNNLVDYLLDLLSVEVPTYTHHCGSYFGLLRGYVETCPHASVHLSNRSGTRRLLCFLVEEDSEHEETLSIDTGALSPIPPNPISTSIGTEAGPLSIAVPSIVSPQKDAGFPTWASALRNWTASQGKELGNFYLLLAHMLLQSNFDQFRNCRKSTYYLN
ncbi:unnamed protein product [Rodentolepis nana]|uniref:USP domain-containing protein n=1 Tax=Rodentolepis nana TaxID=102285 RepID=A0A0R3TJL6_RODNA|nr:unnamed protein product [Rodentolepis nana]